MNRLKSLVPKARQLGLTMKPKWLKVLGGQPVHYRKGSPHRPANFIEDKSKVRPSTRSSNGTIMFRKPGAALEFTKRRAPIFMKYASAELRPPTPGEIGEAYQILVNLPKTFRRTAMNLTVKEAMCYGILLVDIWVFCVVGEIMGRGFHMYGYVIDGAYGKTKTMITEEDLKKAEAEGKFKEYEAIYKE